jgi:hypothetical protein
MPSLYELSSGHNPQTIQRHGLDERQLLRHFGAAVLLAVAVAATSWGVAGYTLSKENGSEAAIAVAVAAGILGAMIVLVVDRAAIFILDSYPMRRTAYALFIIGRVSLVSLVGMNSAPAILAVLMKHELTIEALRMREASGDARNRHLAEQQDLPALRAQADQAEIDAAEAHKAVGVVTPEVKQKRGLAQACKATYARRRTALIGQGIEPAEATRELSNVNAHCKRLQAEAEQAHKSYVDRMTAAAADANDKLQQANATIDKSNIDVKARAADAELIERAALNPQSSLVVESLLHHSRAAYVKFLAIVAVIVMLELLPLLTKLLAPRSIPGTRIATEHAIATLKYERQHNAAVEEAAVASSARSMLSTAMLDVLASPETRDQIEGRLAAGAVALAPFEIFYALLREIESAELKVAAAVQAYPSSAEAISGLYEKMLDEVAKTASGIARPLSTMRNVA